MKPITFTCEETLPLAPEDIARQVLDLTKWPDFHGYGPIPGIKRAEFEVRTPGIVGSRILVTNRDRSSHVEEIVEWQPDHRIRLQMKDFSPPLSRLATGFEETWEFQRTGNEKANKTVSMWRAVPDDLLDLKPHEKTNSIRTILVHQLLSERRSLLSSSARRSRPSKNCSLLARSPSSKRTSRSTSGS